MRKPAPISRLPSLTMAYSVAPILWSQKLHFILGPIPEMKSNLKAPRKPDKPTLVVDSSSNISSDVNVFAAT